MVIIPKSPSFARWRRLSKGNDTILRSLEHECIKGVKLPGLVLDVGGGKGFPYLELIETDRIVHSVNINEHVRPTIIADLNKGLPLGDAVYDHVISFNTLEHIREDSQLIAEILRILKPNGSFLITVPFLYRIHGSPFDFHRHTAEWWEKAFTALDVPKENLEIEPLLWCPLSSVCSNLKLFRGGLLGRTLKKGIMLIEVIRQVLSKNGKRNDHYANFALGYVITGIK